MSSTVPSCPPRKRRLAAALQTAGLINLASAGERRRPVLRIVNCHSVPPRFASQFARQLGHLSRFWAFGRPSDLPALLEGRPKRPTLLIVFDDGLASTVEHAAPIVESLGGRAIFAVPAAWPDVARSEQASWFEEHVYPVPTELHKQNDDRVATTWEALRAAADRGHEVWSHGFEHARLTNDLPRAMLEREIITSKAILEEKLGTTVRGYCPPISYVVPPEALSLVRRTYELAFGGRPNVVRPGVDRHLIPRSNIEASWPQSVVDMQLSPLGDFVTKVLERVRS